MWSGVQTYSRATCIQTDPAGRYAECYRERVSRDRVSFGRTHQVLAFGLYAVPIDGCADNPAMGYASGAPAQRNAIRALTELLPALARSIQPALGR
jgi:hypothetical protein